MKIVHMHHDAGFDAAAEITLDPDALAESGIEVPPKVERGLFARFTAVHSGECVECGAEPTMLNRRARRSTWKGKKALFDGYVRHSASCPAQDRAVRQWVYEHRTLSA